MKNLTLFLMMFFGGSSILLSQDKESTSEEVTQEEVKAQASVPEGSSQAEGWIREFSNVEMATRKKYIQYFSAAEQLFAQKRVMEALLVTDELKKMFDGNPGLYNLRGACYVELKNYEEALKNFKKAKQMNPNNQSVDFNMAEVYFVMKDYAKALEMFRGLSEQLEAKNLAAREEGNVKAVVPLSILSLIDFKVFLCALRSGDKDTAEAYAHKYSELDDTPFAFCVEAVKFFDAKNEPECERKLIAAQKIYEPSGFFEPFRDALTEVEVIKSITTVKAKNTEASSQKGKEKVGK